VTRHRRGVSAAAATATTATTTTTTATAGATGPGAREEEPCDHAQTTSALLVHAMSNKQPSCPLCDGSPVLS
jgi:hypothetical protein